MEVLYDLNLLYFCLLELPYGANVCRREILMNLTN